MGPGVDNAGDLASACSVLETGLVSQELDHFIGRRLHAGRPLMFEACAVYELWLGLWHSTQHSLSTQGMWGLR